MGEEDGREPWGGAGGEEPPQAPAPAARSLTPGVPAQDEFADFVVDEDEEAVGEGTEPPAGPAEGEEGVRPARAGLPDL